MQPVVQTLNFYVFGDYHCNLKSFVSVSFRSCSISFGHGLRMRLHVVKFVRISLSAFEDTLRHPNLTVNMALATVRLATQHSTR